MLVVSSDVLNAIVQGETLDEQFDKKVRKEFKDDIRVLRNLEKAVWGYR